MVFDAHDRAFAFFRGLWSAWHLRQDCKMVVEAIFVGKDNWLYNRRFLQMCSHYLLSNDRCVARLIVVVQIGPQKCRRWCSPKTIT